MCQILDVNHAWDAQYKKLKADLTNQIKELKQQVEFYKTSETQKKYEAVRNSYKKVIDDERRMKEDALQDKRVRLYMYIRNIIQHYGKK